MNNKKTLISRFFNLLSWPTRSISTRTRLSIGLSIGVLSLVLLAQFFNIIPNRNNVIMLGRGLQTETLALTGTALATATRDMSGFEEMLKNVVARDPDLVSAGFRNSRGKLRLDVGNHAANWVMPLDGKSTDQYMFVPVYRHDEQIGQLELCHRPLVSISSWFRSNTANLALFLVSGSFLLFNLILYRFIKQMDPRGAVPRRVREALDNLAEGLLILKDDDCIMLSNSMFAQLVGVHADKLIGQNVTGFPWLRDDQQSLPWHDAVKQQRPVLDRILQIVDSGGTLRTFSVSASPVMSQGDKCRGVMVTFDDITVLEEHKQELIAARRQADAANEAKSVFLSRMSHEIRTPMNAIIGYTDLLRQGDSSKGEQRKYLSTIHSSGEHLLDLINDILDLSKIEAGQMTIEKRRCHLVPIINHVIESLKVRAEQKSLLLDYRIEGQIPAEIETDETRLRQILINTIGNAIKFTEQGGVRLAVGTTQEGMIRFEVADTGVGIPESALSRIFDPFSQADNSVTRKFGGTGLGLSISKQLAEALGGGISVRSVVDEGTVFSILIDPGTPGDTKWISAQQVDQELASSEDAPVETAVRFQRGHLLIVDDAEANRDLACLMMGRLGLTCDTAENGRVALERMRTGRYDVVLMDMNMPVMDGLTATGILRAEGCTVPVVALTALAMDEERQKCLAGGCNGFLTKPIRMQALTRVLTGYLPFERLAVDRPPAPETLQPAAGPGEHPGLPVKTPSVSSDAGDVIEAGLMETLASLGLDDLDNRPAPAATDQAGDLVLPDVVQTSIPCDDDAMMAIAGRFVTRLQNRIGEFDDAWSAGDLSRLSDLGHWLAGAAATVGFNDFVSPSRELERADGSDPRRIQELISHLHQLVERIGIGGAALSGPDA